MSFVSISVALRASSLAGTALVRDAVERSGGLITDAREISSWAVALTVETERARLESLHGLLTHGGAIWLDGSDLRLSELAGRAGEGSDPVTVLVHVEFINDEPERPVKVPAVPG